MRPVKAIPQISLFLKSCPRSVLESVCDPYPLLLSPATPRQTQVEASGRQEFLSLLFIALSSVPNAVPGMHQILDKYLLRYTKQPRVKERTQQCHNCYLFGITVPLRVSLKLMPASYKSGSWFPWRYRATPGQTEPS